MLHLDHEGDLFMENPEIYLKATNNVLFDLFVFVFVYFQKAYESAGVSFGIDPKLASG